MLPQAIIILLGSILFPIALSAPYQWTRQVTNTSKIGLGWPSGNTVDIEQFRSTGKVSWYYTWSVFAVDTDLEFVPMFWGAKSIDQLSALNDTISKLHVKAVLGMNEPQQPGQSNLSPKDGAQLWKTYIEPLRSFGVRLGSPAPSSAPSGKTWLQDFLTACAGGCTVDFIALHWYDINPGQFIAYLEDFHNTFQRPLWITEWACQNFNDLSKQCSYTDVVSFLNQTQSYMDNTPFVERYAWYGAMKDLQGVDQNDALLDSSGKINDLGKEYIGTLNGSNMPSLPQIGNAAQSVSSMLESLVRWILLLPHVILFFHYF